MPSSNVVQTAVIRFANQRIDRLHTLIARQCQHVIHHRVGNARYGKRPRQENRRFDFPEFFHLRRTGKLSKRISNEDRARNLFSKQVSRVRKDRGDTRADVIGLHNGLLTDRNARDVGDRVYRSSRKNADDNTDFTRARPIRVLGKREGYKKTDFSPADVAETLRFAGFWRMASKYCLTGMGELWRSLRKEAFVTALRRLVPELTAADVRPAGSGVRAQAVDTTGRLLDDFHVVRGPQMIHILNAPSPAATASLAIGRAIAQMANEL